MSSPNRSSQKRCFGAIIDANTINKSKELLRAAVVENKNRILVQQDVEDVEPVAKMYKASNSPRKSPRKSPRNSPKKSPKKSPRKSPKKSPENSPRKNKKFVNLFPDEKKDAGEKEKKPEESEVTCDSTIKSNSLSISVSTSTSHSTSPTKPSTSPSFLSEQACSSSTFSAIPSDLFPGSSIHLYSCEEQKTWITTPSGASSIGYNHILYEERYDALLEIIEENSKLEAEIAELKEEQAVLEPLYEEIIVFNSMLRDALAESEDGPEDGHEAQTEDGHKAQTEDRHEAQTEDGGEGKTGNGNQDNQ